MTGTAIVIHSKTDRSAGGRKPGRDHKKDLEDILGQVGAAKRRLEELADEMDACDMDTDRLGEALDALEDASDLLKDALEEEE